MKTCCPNKVCSEDKSIRIRGINCQKFDFYAFSDWGICKLGVCTHSHTHKFNKISVLAFRQNGIMFSKTFSAVCTHSHTNVLKCVTVRDKCE